MSLAAITWIRILCRAGAHCGLACIATAALLGASAQAQGVRHDKVIVVPAPARVVVDGSLQEWNLAAALDTAYEPALAPRFTARLAFMYDSAALYIGAHVVDDTPMVNAHDPLVEPNIGWAGDALQVRLSSDPGLGWPLKAYVGESASGQLKSDRIIHLTLWYYTGRGEPALQVQYGLDYHGTRVLRGAESGIAFRKDADGAGYTLEARIPWALLNAGAKPPGAGDQLALTVQPLWGDAAGKRAVMSYFDIVNGTGFAYQNASVWGRAELVRSAPVADSAAVRAVNDPATPLLLDVPVPDPQAASASIGIFNAAGTLVRTLPSLKQPAVANGRLRIAWDGLDDDKQALPSGSYVAKVLTHRGIGQKYLTSLHSAGNPTWRTQDETGAWGGDHGPPLAAAADGERVYLAWAISEAGSTIVAADPHFSGPEVAQRIGKKLWGATTVLEAGIDTQGLATDGERVFVAQDGKPYGKHLDPAATNIAAVVLWDAKTGRAVNFPFQKRLLIVSQWQGPGSNLRAIAVNGDLVYASLERENKVVALNWHSGQKVREYALPGPRGLVVEQSGSLVVVSEKSLFRLDPASGRTARLVDRLADPWGLARDAAGNLYVSDRGDAQQVKVYSPSGRLLRTIGKAGGRPAIGRFDPQGMFNPAGIAIDKEGKLWVTEEDDTPRRVSVWGTDGRLVADLLGAGQYATMGTADADHPAWVNTHHTLFEVDYASGRVKTLATLVRPGLRGFQMGTDGERHLDFRHVNGRIYLSHGGRGLQTLFLLDEKTLTAEPVAAFGANGSAVLAGLTPERFPPEQRAEAKTKLAGTWTWSDRNGDRLVQLDEIESVAAAKWGLYWGSWIDTDLTLWTAAPFHAVGVYRVPVKQWLRDGVPVYAGPQDQNPLFKTLGATIHSVMPASDRQSVYVLEEKGDGNVGESSWSAVSRYDLEGRRLWSYRRTWAGFGLSAPLFQPGMVIGAMKLIGAVPLADARELIGVNGYYGQFNLLTSDGLWVAALGKDARYSPAMDDTTIWNENFSGALFHNRDNGKTYLLAGETDLRIWEVTGLDGIRVAQTPFTITEGQRKLALEASSRVDAVADARIYSMSRVQAKVDGKLGQWKLDDTPTIDAGAGRSAKVALGYGEKMLYVAAEVSDASPMLNHGSDPGLLFKTGDSVNIMLATDRAADPRRTRPAVGDLRLLLSVVDDKPVAVLYQPVLPPGVARQPRLFGSPTGAESFDRVRVLDDARVVVARAAGGYRLEAEIPLASIGFSPRAGDTVRGDVGVIYSDAGGTIDVLRSYLFNRDTAVVNDVPTEARLEPSKWGSILIR